MIYFVTAIHTNSGKTLVSAILTKALQADYWKPVQSGMEERDGETVRDLINNQHCLIHEEAYLLEAPMSPHAAAKLENITIDLNNINLPEGDYKDLIVEGAGGVLVPLNDKDFVIDIAQKIDAEIILVSNNYLGSINHTLLTVNELKSRNLRVKGIIFNGPANEETERIILQHSGYKCLLRIPQETEIGEEVVNIYAVKLFETWYE